MTRARRTPPIIAIVAMSAMTLWLGACTGEQAGTSAPATTSTRATSQPPPVERVYVSIGDSYATGYRPAVGGAPAGAARDGFAYLVAERADLRLINLACGGATSASVRDTPGCAPANRALDAADTTNLTQLDAAVRVLREHEGRVGLVTVVVGGNDLAPCVLAQDVPRCTAKAVSDVQANLAAMLPVLREAAGDAPIVGLTYPDVFLGAWVSSSLPNGESIARRSVSLFRDFFNPVLEAEYAKVDATFVDVTAATGAYGPLTETTRDPTYGPVPVSVATVCELTYFCSHTDVHATPVGHRKIAAAVLDAR